ncbi:hypothetical protein PHLH6_28530 [Pseudomonas sp. Seg1]|jgi:hypothetical protein|nr:hypothetical protein PHLH6_28530 [Pseudomonas sp. Seg1]
MLTLNSHQGIAASLSKAVDWQYEREWRLVFPDDDREVEASVSLRP